MLWFNDHDFQCLFVKSLGADDEISRDETNIKIDIKHRKFRDIR